MTNNSMNFPVYTFTFHQHGDGDPWSAHCAELDLKALGETKQAALALLNRKIEAHLAGEPLIEVTKLWRLQ